MGNGKVECSAENLGAVSLMAQAAWDRLQVAESRVAKAKTAPELLDANDALMEARQNFTDLTKDNADLRALCSSNEAATDSGKCTKWTRLVQSIGKQRMVRNVLREKCWCEGDKPLSGEIEMHGDMYFVWENTGDPCVPTASKTDNSTKSVEESAFFERILDAYSKKRNDCTLYGGGYCLSAARIYNGR